MNFYEVNFLLKEDTKHVRWMIRRDLCSVVRLLERQPGFGRYADQECDDNHPVAKYLIEILRERNCISLVYKDSEDKIQGMILYYITRSSYECPIIIGETSEVRKSLIKKVIAKLEDHKNKNLFIRTHFYLPLLNDFKELGFRTQQIGEDIVAYKIRREPENLPFDNQKEFGDTEKPSEYQDQ